MTPTPTHPVPHVQATAPERIYLVIGEDCPADADFGDLFDELTWCQHKIDANSIEYVRADLASLPAVQGVVPTPEPSGATLSPGGHASDCATNNAPAYPSGPCDCLPTPQMCRAAVEYANGSDVYDRVPREVLEIEESIYAEVWRAMQAVAPQVVQQQGR